MSHYDRNRRRSRVACSACLMLAFAFEAEAQSTAGFPPVGGPPPSSRPSPPPYVAPPSPPPYVAPPQPPAPQPPPQYSPAPYAPAPAPPQYPQYAGPPASTPPPYYPGAVPMYPAPVMPSAPPPPNPLQDDGLRYRQVLGAYHRGVPGPETDARPRRAAYVRVVDRSRMHHDGFYFRFAGGIGFGHDAAESNRPLPTPYVFSFELTPLSSSGGAIGAATEIAAGYTVAAGLALGAGVYTTTIPPFSAKVTDPNTGSYAYKLSQLAVIGPVADWYFFPDVGFHAQVSPGVATYVAGAASPSIQGPPAQAHTAVGFGLMLGLGYEWWIADEWSMGFLGRLTYGATNGSDNRGVSWTHTTYAPALLLTATYN